ncbi:MAG TPA: hypothetical protein VMZ25_10305 [Terriglobales bacterium]|nr:hypothetical protein [Terriglobales bacterium]
MLIRFRYFAVHSVLIILLTSTSTGQAAPAKVAGKAPNLQAACKAVLSAIETSGPKNLVPYIADAGVALGNGRPATSRKDIMDQLTTKHGFYCRVFDTACLRKEPAAAKDAMSYRETITSASSEFATCTPDIHAKGQTGTLLVVLSKRKPQEKRLTFEFTLEKNRWKLTGMPNY